MTHPAFPYGYDIPQHRSFISFIPPGKSSSRDVTLRFLRMASPPKPPDRLHKYEEADNHLKRSRILRSAGGHTHTNKAHDYGEDCHARTRRHFLSQMDTASLSRFIA